LAEDAPSEPLNLAVAVAEGIPFTTSKPAESEQLEADGADHDAVEDMTCAADAMSDHRDRPPKPIASGSSAADDAEQHPGRAGRKLHCNGCDGIVSKYTVTAVAFFYL